MMAPIQVTLEESEHLFERLTSGWNNLRSRAESPQPPSGSSDFCCSLLVKCCMSHLTVLSWFWSNKVAQRSFKLTGWRLPFSLWKSFLLTPDNSRSERRQRCFLYTTTQALAGPWMKRVISNKTKEQSLQVKHGLFLSVHFIGAVTTVLTFRGSKM